MIETGGECHCRSCGFCDIRGRDWSNEKEIDPECRRRSPGPEGWPKVRLNEWCGKYEKRPDTQASTPSPK